jgi:GH15 family glucan-1,4-alpha-glucosidase
VYGICLEDRLTEREMHRLTGYRAKGPVMLGNKDSEMIQHDVYGAVILALTQAFFDRRLANPGTEVLFHQLEELGEKAIQYHDQFDTYRNKVPAIHTFSSAMCWAACDRLSKIADHLKVQGRAEFWRVAAWDIRKHVLENAWNDEIKSFTNTWAGRDVDAFLLLLPQIGFIDANDEKYLSTLKLVEKRLRRGDYIAVSQEDSVVHNSATFWYINILAAVGRMEEARQLFSNMLKTLNRVGLLSETVDPNTRELWGNFPQSIAMVGLIDCAIRLSKPWKVVL